ncbi:hypothetical protein BGZ58_007013 [Dissophora ornata]|nr:hypothetical protein BGZ58_007013 [Dissophora ornata]
MSSADIASTSTPKPGVLLVSTTDEMTTSPAEALPSSMDPSAASTDAEAFAPAGEHSKAQEIGLQNKNAHLSSNTKTQTEIETSSGTALPPGEHASIPANKPAPPEHESTCRDDDKDTTKDPGVNADDSEKLFNDGNEIASDIQERSQLSEVSSNSSDSGDEEGSVPVNGPAVNSAVPIATLGTPVPASTPRKPSNADDSHENSVNSISINANKSATAVKAIVPQTTDGSIAAPKFSFAQLPDEDPVSEDVQSEPTASYTSPNHEWARILQRRLGKGLSDAQLLTRSNSMLASPSILAQSLIQVIPSLQVKDTSGASPVSSARGYQTAEELFDRPANIEPSQNSHHYEDQYSNDDAFPSSAFTRNSQVPLLLFAPLNPDQLNGRSSSAPQPTAPPPPVENATVAKQQQPPVSAATQSQLVQHQQQSIPPQLVVPPPIPIPIPPISTAQSPASRAYVVSPAGIEAHHSPSQLRDLGMGPRNVRQSQALNPSGQEERPGLTSHGASSRTLLGQGSSSSLTATPVPSVFKDQHATGTSNYPIAPIQYTPVTQYKAKEGSKSKKPRDTMATAKDVRALVESPEEYASGAETKASGAETKEPAAVALTAEAAPTTPAAPTTSLSENATSEPALELNRTGTPVDGTAQWALEALSGLSDVNFDATLPVSLAVGTTLSTSSHAKDSVAKPPMVIPPISSGSRNNASTTEASPIVIKKIPSPFESMQIVVEDTRQKPTSTTPELKSQTLQSPTAVDPYQNLVEAAPLPSTTVLASSSYPGSNQPITSAQPNYTTFEQSATTAGRHHGVHGAHQANRSISSLRDFQTHALPGERLSQDYGHLRRGDFIGSADPVQPSTTHGAPSAVPSPFNLGTGYQIPWLPQSRPILPPKADVNSIDVPALTGRQLLPLKPRSVEVDSSDPCLHFKHIGEAIRHWGQNAPEGNAFANLDGKGVECGSWDWSFTLGRAEMIAKAIHDKTQLRTGARVALIFRLSEVLEFIAAFYGAILAGVVPVLVNQIQDFSEMVYVMTSAKVELALTTQFNHKSLQKDLRKGAVWPSNVTWWQTDILETWAPKNSQQERLPLLNNDLAYIEYTKSASGELKGVVVSHKSLIAQCQVLYSSFTWRPALYHDKNGNLQTDPRLATDNLVPHAKDRKNKSASLTYSGTVMTWLEPRQQSGLILGCIMGVFCGNFTVFMESAITTVSGLWAHSVAAYRANIAFADYIGVQKLLRNFRLNPQATVTPTRPDLRFLQTVYIDAQSSNLVLNREFLDDYLYPLGMIVRHNSSSSISPVSTAEDSPMAAPNIKSKMDRSDMGVIAFLSLLDHGGMIVSLRDTLGPPQDIETHDLQKQYRRSTLPQPRRPSAAADVDTASSTALKSPQLRLQPSGSEKASRNDALNTRYQDSLLYHPPSSLACGEYLLHRGALRSNRIAILATGDEAYRQRDEPGGVLVGAFGYALAGCTAFIVDPETMALSLPDMVGEIWVSSPGMPVGFWGLPEHTDEVFNTKPYIVTEENMIPTVYSPPGCNQLLRTGLLGAMIEGRVIVFGSYWDRLQQDVADPMKSIGVQFEYHHCSDLTQTLLNKVGGVGEISVFECLVNKEFLPVVCIELTRDSKWNGQSINAVAQHVAINARHYLKEVNALRSYCVAVWDTNMLPRIFQNGRRVVDHALCKKMFELGRIYRMLYFATFTDDVLFNIPRGDDPVNGFWSRECVVKRQLRQGAPARHVQYTTNTMIPDAYDEKTKVFMGKFHNITDILMWRSIIQPEDVAFVDVDSRGKESKSIPFKKFNQKVTGYAMYLEKKHGLKAGDHVLLWFTQDLDYIITLHACWVLGLIPIPLPLPDIPQSSQSQGSLPSHFTGHAATGSAVGHVGGLNMSFGPGPSTSQGPHSTNPAFSAKLMEDKRNGILQALLRIMDEVKVKAVLGNTATEDYLKQKTTGAHLRTCRSTFTAIYLQTPEVFSSSDVILPTFCNVSKAAKTKQILGALSGYAPRKEWFGANYPAVYLIDPEAKAGSITSKKLLKLNHETLNNLCRNQKLQFQTLTGQPIVTAMSVFHGLGFIHGCLCGIYNGGPTVILQPVDFYANPMVWLELISRYRAQDVALSYPLLDQLLLRLDGTHGALSAVGAVSLESVKNFMICGHGRIQQEKTKMAIGRLGALKLEPEALNLVYSHPFNPMVTSQVEREAGTVRIHVSSRNLRYGLVNPTSEGDDPTGIWLEDSGISTVCTSIAIVHPETFEVCAANQIGEIWICSDSSINSFHVPVGFVSNPTHQQPFNASIMGYDSRVKYVRTGDLGFLWNGQQQHSLQRQGSLTAQSQKASHAGSGSFQLFVLGRMEESFQMHGLLHFASDIEATVESSHANVALQGCVTFKTLQGQVICVVKVQNQEPEVLVSMYIPVMHAILKQHQFLPDTIVLVGEAVLTSRRPTDGLKPRETICGLYTSEHL